MELVTRLDPRILTDLRKRLALHRFSHFVALATNDGNVSTPRIHGLLEARDARCNRFLVGKKWDKRPDERLLWFAFPEALNANPHWHVRSRSIRKINRTRPKQ